MQQMCRHAAMIGMLTICAVTDIQKKKICINLVLTFGIIGVVLHMIWREQSIQSLLLGMAIGVSLLIFSVISGGKVGAGDGMILMVTGVYLGIRQNAELFLTGLVFCSMWAMYLMVFKRKSRKTEIPFVPFLLAAYVEMLAFSIV